MLPCGKDPIRTTLRSKHTREWCSIADASRNADQGKLARNHFPNKDFGLHCSFVQYSADVFIIRNTMQHHLNISHL